MKKSLTLGILLLSFAGIALAQNGGGVNGGGGGGGSGTVTNVNTTVPAPLTGTSCSYSTSGTCAITWTTGQTANQVLASPDGTTGAVSLRSLTLADIPAGVPTASANPSASIGLTAVNGSATTFMRSDGAPALSQAITPTMTGIWKWSLTEPRLLLNQAGANANAGLWDIDLAANILSIRTRTDADGAGVTAISVTRSTTTTALSSVTIGASAVPLNLASGGATITTPTTGKFAMNGVIVSAGTKFTASGCSNGTTLGGEIAGSFVSGTTGSCTVVITFPLSSPNGFVCSSHDVTAGTNFTQTASSVNTCTVSGVTTSGDVVNFMALGY